VNLVLMKSIACRERVAFASDLQVDGVRLASDCLNVVKSIQQNNFGSYGPIHILIIFHALPPLDWLFDMREYISTHDWIIFSKRGKIIES